MFKFILLLLVVPLFALHVPKSVASALKNKPQRIAINFKNPVDFKAYAEKHGFEWDNLEEKKRGRLVVSLLKQRAAESQTKFISNYLLKKNVKYTQYWIANAISIDRADESTLLDLQNYPEVDSVELEEDFQLIDPIVEKESKRQGKVELGVEFVEAPKVWKKGFTGKSIVVGVIDTGAHLHVALNRTYRGNDEGHSHADSWLDGTSLRRSAPYDDNVHGTHCHGTVGASEPGKETVGVAPDSKWVSCKFLTARGSGNYGDAVKCLQFMVAPGGDSDARPHVVSNSYGGGSRHTGFVNGLKALDAAGVEMVFAAGNSGSRCSTVLFPASERDSFSVGALNRGLHTLARFSSRGPVRGTQIMKPEITAPGVSVRSTSNTNTGYRSLSGTSMACPHVAGVVALLWDAVPSLSRKIKETRKLLTETAEAQELTRTECSSIGSPNNLYGHGTVRAAKAVEEAEGNYIIKSVVDAFAKK